MYLIIIFILLVASRGSITKLLRDTTLIDDKDLAQQVYLVRSIIFIFKLYILLNTCYYFYLQCVLQDDQYGPLSDTINQ